MKYLVRFFVIILITIYTTTSKSESLLVVYIDMDKVMNETVAGKSIVEQLEKIHKTTITEFKKIEDKLKSEETAILSKKNILSNDEYIEEINLLKKKINIIATINLEICLIVKIFLTQLYLCLHLLLRIEK